MNVPAQKPNKGRPQGGITFGLHYSCDDKAETIYKTNNVLFVQLNKCKVHLLVAYFNPKTDIIDIVEELAGCLSKTQTDRHNSIIAGDFNCRLDTTNEKGDTLVDFMLMNRLHCANDPSVETYIFKNGKSTIDLCFTNQPSLLANSNIVPSILTKHHQVLITAAVQYEKREQFGKPIRKCDMEKLFSSLTAALSTEPTLLDAGCLLSTLQACFGNASVTRNRKSKPWFDRELYHINICFKRALSNVKLYADNDSLSALNYWKRMYKQTCSKKQILYYKMIEEKQIQTAETNTSKFWTIMKSKNSPSSNPHINYDTLFNHFAQLYHKDIEHWTIDFLQATDHDYITTGCQKYDYQIDAEINPIEIYHAVKSLKNNKACGIDLISGEVLKSAYPIIHEILHYLFNMLFEQKLCPEQWKTSILTVLYKGKGNKQNPNNYRGIAVLPALYKTYAHIICERLTLWAESSGILPNSQHGFRRSKSTLSAITELFDSSSAAMDRYGCYYICFIDFEKAFDSIDRKMLFKKLSILGLSEQFLHVLYSLIASNYVRLKSGNYLMQKIAQNIGAPQGDKLSPLLFAIYIADLDAILSNGSKILFYADDLAIAHENIRIVQESVTSLERYCDQNGLRVNITKSKVMKIRKNGGRLSRADYIRYNSQPLEFANEFKYLGIILQTNLKATKHLKHLKNKALIATNTLASKMSLEKISLQSAPRLFNAVVTPASTYGIKIFENILTPELWEQHMKTVHSIFFKKWAGVPRRLPTIPLINRILYADDLKIAQVKSRNSRKAIATFYSNGCHHRLCFIIGCYTADETNRFCRCVLCAANILDNYHICVCPKLPDTSCIDRVKFMLFSEVTPILEPKTKNELMFENQMYCNENPQDL